jgi:hypothetical protein
VNDGIERLRTFNEWAAMGYRVRKGEKSCARNKQGEAMFSSEQVWRPDDTTERVLDEGLGPIDTYDKFKLGGQ